MNLTYLLLTGGIVLATMLVYALLSWGRAPRSQKPEEPVLPVIVEPAATEPPRRKRRAADAPALAGKRPSGKPRHDPS